MKSKKKVSSKNPVIDNVVKPIVKPFHEFKPKDFLQVIIGATILAIPVGFTQETWEIGEYISNLNIILMALLSIGFISTFVYYHYHSHRTPEQKGHKRAFVKRVIFTYLGSFILVAFLLTLIHKAPWSTDFLLALKRTIIVTLPASMSASIADTIK